MTRPILEALRQYVKAWGHLDSVSEPDSGASEDDISAVWHQVEDAREELFSALFEFDDADESDDVVWEPLGELPPGAVFVTRTGSVVVKSEYFIGNDVSNQSMCIIVGSGEYAHFAGKNDEMVRRIPAGGAW